MNGCLCLLLASSVSFDNVRISWIGDSQTTNTKVFTASSSQLNVVTLVVVNTGLCEHSVILNLGSAELGCVVGENDQFGLSLTKLSDSLSVAEIIFSRFDHQLKPGVNRGTFFFCFFRNHFRRVLESDFC